MSQAHGVWRCGYWATYYNACGYCTTHRALQSVKSFPTSGPTFHPCKSYLLLWQDVIDRRNLVYLARPSYAAAIIWFSAHMGQGESSIGQRWYAINQLRSRTMVGFPTRDAQLLSGVTLCDLRWNHKMNPQWLTLMVFTHSIHNTMAM